MPFSLRPKIEAIPRPLAGIYEKACRLAVDGYYAPMARRIVAHLKAGTLLDLGTGPGYLPVEIARRSDRIRIHGVDLNLALVRAARANAARAGVGRRVTFQRGTASGLRFDDACFDMVISTGMLHMVKDPAGMFKECRRVLKPGGQAWIFDPARVSSGVDRGRYLASLTPAQRLLFKAFLVYTRLNPPNVYHRRQVEAMADTAGFTRRQVRQRGRELEIYLTK